MISGSIRGPNKHTMATLPAAGVRVLVPGWPQWNWSQRGRGAILLGSYLSALGVGLFAWGTPAGPLMLAFAFLTHVASASDVVRQRAFPGFGPWIPVVSASAGLGIGYLPLLGSLCVLAWPSSDLDSLGPSYLVNLWAYRSVGPVTGNWVWIDPRPGQGGGPGRVVAREGQEIEWSQGNLRIEGKALEWFEPPNASSEPDFRIRMNVPKNHSLVWFPNEPPDLLLVENPRIQGRVWAQHAPLWERRFLP